jgi:hypothetical protein
MHQKPFRLPDLAHVRQLSQGLAVLAAILIAIPFHAAAQVFQEASYNLNQPPVTASADTDPADPLVNAPSTVLANAAKPPVPKLTHEQKVQSEAARNTACESGDARGKTCRVRWSLVLAQSLFFLASQHGGNIALDSDTRDQLTHGDFWAKYEYCVEHFRYNRWKDDDPFGVDYLGHPLMGAVTSSIYEQNDPKQRALTFENTHRYWMGRLRAMAYSAAYSAQWKIGPASEASIGNTGINTYYSIPLGRYTNETGMQDFFITPIGGLAWNVGEDAIDRFILSRIRRGTHNRVLLLASGFATPGRSAANIARFRAPYYRDPDLANTAAK